MTPTADGLYVMSDSQHMSGEFHPRFTFLPTAGGIAPAKAIKAVLPPSSRTQAAQPPARPPRDSSSSGPTTAPRSAPRPR